MANEALSGAASGAAQGSTFGPVGTAIGAGVGAISGFMSGRRRKKAASQERRRQARVRRIASPQHLSEVIQSLTPMFREIVASGLGPQFQTGIADALAKHGLTGTGVGEAFRSSAAAAPAIFATKGAMEEGSQVVGRELAAEGLAGAEPAPTQNPLLDALMGGARGFLSAGGTFSATKPAAPNIAPDLNARQNMLGGVPNITPEQQAADRRGVPNVFAR